VLPIEEFLRIAESGCCVGCGVCAAMQPDAIEMHLVGSGMYQPIVIDESRLCDVAPALLDVCPFSDHGCDESSLAAEEFGLCEFDERLGTYRKLFIGYAAEGQYRESGSSGGIATWILAELLNTGAADYVLHVTSGRGGGDALFVYGFSSSADEVCAAAKSKYYPVELSHVLARVIEKDARYVLVGLPCFLKAVRRLARVNPVVRKRVVFYVGLVCGHLKSRAFADAIGWQAGIVPGDLQAIDFRVKQAGLPASSYSVTCGSSAFRVQLAMSDVFVGNWGYGYFKYSACEFCDDVFAETGDVAIGDAWLPGVVDDSKGHCIIIARSHHFADMLQRAIESGRIVASVCSASRMVLSQAGGLRHRRTGLSYRLWRRREDGQWAPRKRVKVTAVGFSARQRALQDAREALRIASHVQWERCIEGGSFMAFQDAMLPYVQQCIHLRLSFARRILLRLRSLIGRISGAE
jgi:coenzyme F420 hydrogenase subunit beta